MRKIVYHVAVTLDSYIADINGSYKGFFQDSPQVTDYLNSLKNYNTVIMGRKTYEAGYQYGLKAGELTYPHMRHFVFSKTLKFTRHDPRLIVVNEKELETIISLKAESGMDIYLCGGGAFAGWLLKNELIDFLKLKINPVSFGNGIHLFGHSDKKHQLMLLHEKHFPNGAALLTYKIDY